MTFYLPILQDAVDFYYRVVSIIIGQTNNNAYQQATDLLVNLSKKLLNQNAKLLTTMLGKLIKQYKAKRNMMKLLKTHFGECF